MIHEFSRCPFCKSGVLAIDDDGPIFIFEPDRAKGRPCPHLALATVAFEVHSPGALESPPRSSSWHWSHGDGLRGPDAMEDKLGDYLTDLACDGLPWPVLAPKVPYHLVGVFASEREDAREGWGYFPMVSDGEPLIGSINGWALYASDPAALIREIHKRLDIWAKLSLKE